MSISETRSLLLDTRALFPPNRRFVFPGQGSTIHTTTAIPAATEILLACDRFKMITQTTTNDLSLFSRFGLSLRKANAQVVGNDPTKGMPIFANNAPAATFQGSPKHENTAVFAIFLCFSQVVPVFFPGFSRLWMVYQGQIVDFRERKAEMPIVTEKTKVHRRAEEVNG
jgi:hypothetical protein